MSLELILKDPDINRICTVNLRAECTHQTTRLLHFNGIRQQCYYSDNEYRVGDFNSYTVSHTFEDVKVVLMNLIDERIYQNIQYIRNQLADCGVYSVDNQCNNDAGLITLLCYKFKNCFGFKRRIKDSEFCVIIHITKCDAPYYCTFIKNGVTYARTNSTYGFKEYV